MNNIYGMAPVTFQHLATSRLTNKGKSGLTFYGRTATGESVAVHQYDIQPYGFIKCHAQWWNDNRPYIMEYLKWLACKDKIDSMEKFEQTRPSGRIIKRLIQIELEDEPLIIVTPIQGYNIRHVHEGEPDDFMRVTCEKSNTLRHFIKCIKSPHTLKTAITAVRKKMRTLSKPQPDREKFEDYDSWVEGCKDMAADYELPSMPSEPHWGQLEVYETHIGDDLIWMTDNHLTSCGWMTATGTVGETRTACALDIEIRDQTNWIKHCALPPQPMAPYVILSYDIESQPHVIPGQRETEFPVSNRDPILCIGVCVFNMVNMSIKQYCFMWEPEGPQCESYKPLNPEEQTDEYKAEDTDVRSFRDEYGMLLAFQNFIIDEIDPDIITGYNILNFDNVYTIERAQHLYNTQFKDTGIDKAWCWGRIKGRECQLKKKYTWTAQKGGKETWQCRIEGREFMDLFKITMDDHKLRSYKMDNVAKEFLGTCKIDIDYDDIPIMQQTAAGRERLGAYCAKDAWIPCQLIIKMSKATNAILMSQVAGVSLDTILNRGQQIRTLSLMLKKVKERAENGDVRWFIPDEDDPPNTGSFEGAVVITPIPGFWDRPVATLDFASLYPSIMRAWNMCFSTIISNHTEAKERGYVWSDTEENPSYRPVRTFTYPEGGRFDYQTLDNDICFVTREQRRGILPELLEELHTERKLAKRQMKACKEGSMEYNVLDGRQLALKVSMNSMYGFTGASKGFLPEKRIASAVTRAGRGMANETKFMCEDRYKEYGVKVVYGDSVSGDTPLLLKKNDQIFIENIESLQLGDTPTYTWTENGWTEIKRKICHELSTKKKMLKIYTHTGIVKCTSDHSLVDSTGEAMFPGDVSVGKTALMQSWPDDDHGKLCTLRFTTHRWFVYRERQFTSGKEAVILAAQPRAGQWVDIHDDIPLTNDLAQVLGMFMGDGSCGSYGTGTRSKSTWAINNLNRDMLETYQTILQQCFPRFTFNILDTVHSSGVYKLVVSSSHYGAVAKFVSHWRTLCYHDQEKKVPECILNAPFDICCAFWSGLRQKSHLPEISQKGSIACLGIYTLMKSMGYEVVVGDRADKPNIYRLRARTKSQLRKPTNVVKKIVEIPYEKYVYDLTTENHHFQAGVGNIIVHNTDSVFVHFPKSLCPGETREEIIKNANRIGEEMGVMCTKAFLPPNDLEFEKVYYPLLLKGKKRYAGFKYEPGCKPKLDVKGFECVRRDFAPIVSKTQKNVFVLLCEQNDVAGAVQYARQVVVDLLEGRTPLDDLILSKQLTRPPHMYKNPQPHVELAKHLQKILPETQAPKTGDRIDYIIKPGRGKTFTRAASPDDVREGKCSIDYAWYLSNQLKDPLTRVFEMVIDNTSDIFKVDKIRQSKIGTNSMFNSWVSKKRDSADTRKADVVNIKRRKVGIKKNKNISDFF
jgi:DNA polymerase elongation subunit (family B)